MTNITENEAAMRRCFARCCARPWGWAGFGGHLRPPGKTLARDLRRGPGGSGPAQTAARFGAHFGKNTLGDNQGLTHCRQADIAIQMHQGFG